MVFLKEMEDETRRGGEVADAPGLAYVNSFQTMEELLDKLKLLDYETDFCKGLGFKPFSRLKLEGNISF